MQQVVHWLLSLQHPNSWFLLCLYTGHREKLVIMRSTKGKLPKNIELLKLRAKKFTKGYIPWNKGKQASEETKYKISKSGKGRIPWNKGKKLFYSVWNKGIKNDKISGEKHWNYKIDRNQLVKKQLRNDSLYYRWRKEVKDRDHWKCRISNGDCSGDLIVHHILGWKDFPELRYQINNGITLCHAHHPRKRAEEKRLVPTFMELVSVSKA